MISIDIIAEEIKYLSNNSLIPYLDIAPIAPPMPTKIKLVNITFRKIN